MFNSDKHDLEKVSADSNVGPLPEKLSSNDIETFDETESDAKYGTTQRGLKSRHIQLIALGGCIGTVSLRHPAPLGFPWPLLKSIIACPRR